MAAGWRCDRGKKWGGEVEGRGRTIDNGFKSKTRRIRQGGPIEAFMHF